MEEKSFLPPRAQAMARSSAASFENPSRIRGLAFAHYRLVRTRNHHSLNAPVAVLSSLHRRGTAGRGSSHTVRSAKIGLSRTPANRVEFGTVALSETAEISLNVLKPGPRAAQVSNLQIAGHGFSIHDSSRLPFTVAVNGGADRVAMCFPPKTTGDGTGQLTTKSSFPNQLRDTPCAHSESTIQSGSSHIYDVECVESQENQNTSSSIYAESTS